MPRTKAREQQPIQPSAAHQNTRQRTHTSNNSADLDFSHQYQHQSNPQQYSTDSPPHDANPLSRTNATLNLSVLRRHNPSISSILSIAPFAAVYAFSTTTSTIATPPIADAAAGGWEKTGVEGTLFVVALSSSPADEDVSDEENDEAATESEPRFAVLILNRRGLSNFFVELRREEDVEMAEGGFVIVQGTEGALTPPGPSGVGAGGVATITRDPEVMENGDAYDEERTQPALYGLWIFSDSGSAGDDNAQLQQQQAEQEGPREINARVMMECARLAEEVLQRRSARRQLARERDLDVIAKAEEMRLDWQEPSGKTWDQVGFGHAPPVVSDSSDGATYHEAVAPAPSEYLLDAKRRQQQYEQQPREEQTYKQQPYEQQQHPIPLHNNLYHEYHERNQAAPQSQPRQPYYQPQQHQPQQYHQTQQHSQHPQHPQHPQYPQQLPQPSQPPQAHPNPPYTHPQQYQQVPRASRAREDVLSDLFAQARMVRQGSGA